jgi:Type II secretion system (T2SS), protein G
MSKRNSLILLASLITVTSIAVTSQVIAAGDLTPKEARKLIARMAGIDLPSDAVRVKEVSAMGNSATVIAQVETAFRFDKGSDGKWRIAEIRTGDRRWEDVDLLIKALNTEKTSRARAELESIATALESYRREHGFYPEAKTEAALIDKINPRYLARVIRVDPWHQPYQYEGTRGSFLLRSTGPDEKLNTSDDIVVASNPSAMAPTIQTRPIRFIASF